MDTMNQNDREEANVEELEYTPNMDEQSAWIEIVNENGVERYRPLARP